MMCLDVVSVNRPRTRKSMRHSFFLLLTLLAASGCGARTSLPDDDSGIVAGGGNEGGNGASGGAGGSGLSGGGAPDEPCDAFLHSDPITVRAPVLSSARAPGLLLNGTELKLAFIENGSGSGPVALSTLDAFVAWPPTVISFEALSFDVSNYVVGRGRNPPVLYDAFEGAKVALELSVDTPPIEHSLLTGDGLFVTAQNGRLIAGASAVMPDHVVLTTGSYQMGNLPQVEPQRFCSAGRAIADGIPMQDGFLTVFGVVNPPRSNCDPLDPRPPTILQLGRFDNPPELGSSITYTPQDRLVVGDTIVHGKVSSSSEDRAWVVYQSAGDNAFAPPPIFAELVDGTGHRLESPLVVTVGSEGLVTPQLAVVQLGSAVAVAWIDNVDPSAPTILVQLVQADGSLGAFASIPTNEVWQTGRIEMVYSAEQRALLIAWEGGLEQPQIGLARLTCVTAG